MFAACVHARFEEVPNRSFTFLPVERDMSRVAGKKRRDKKCTNGGSDATIKGAASTGLFVGVILGPFVGCV